jgi:hypothetical protein
MIGYSEAQKCAQLLRIFRCDGFQGTRDRDDAMAAWACKETASSIVPLTCPSLLHHCHSSSSCVQRLVQVPVLRHLHRRHRAHHRLQPHRPALLQHRPADPPRPHPKGTARHNTLTASAFASAPFCTTRIIISKPSSVTAHSSPTILYAPLTSHLSTVQVPPESSRLMVLATTSCRAEMEVRALLLHLHLYGHCSALARQDTAASRRPDPLV